MQVCKIYLAGVTVIQGRRLHEMLGQGIQGRDAVGLILLSVLPRMSSSPGVVVAPLSRTSGLRFTA
jgi:hypothetical protein